jgi:FAD/FMN-containing dehydrogenase
MDLKQQIQKIVRGEVLDDAETLKLYSHDASLLEVQPALVVWPKDAADIKAVVKFVAENKTKDSRLSVTVRAAGTCMSGGSLNESIILDVCKHMNHFSVDAHSQSATVEPGVYYRDFEPETLKHDLILPCYTASKNLNALGGMIGNNSAGEKTLSYGKMENFVEELTVVLRDGNEYVFKPIPRAEALRKSHEDTLEGEVYEKLLKLIDANREILNKEKPNVSKNSAGYYLWNVERNGLFDLTRLIVGSQGTLGIVTKARIRLVPVKKMSKLCAVFLKDLSVLGKLVNKILEHKPETLESYDDATFKLAIRYFPEMLAVMKFKNVAKLMWSFLPEVGIILRNGLPKLVLLVEFAGNTEEEIDKKMLELKKDLEPFGLPFRVTASVEEAEKYWSVRRESFNLLRKHVRGRRTAPFIDDICVRPEFLPEFLPKLQKLIKEYKLISTIAGHAGNGNFHIIPLMDLKKEKERKIIIEMSDKVYTLVGEYHGSITAEHNDGLIRTPYLGKMFSEQMLGLFKQTKEIFDPANIFNPKKKVGATLKYLEEHIVKG